MTTTLSSDDIGIRRVVTSLLADLNVAKFESHPQHTAESVANVLNVSITRVDDMDISGLIAGLREHGITLTKFTYSKNPNTGAVTFKLQIDKELTASANAAALTLPQGGRRNNKSKKTAAWILVPFVLISALVGVVYYMRSIGL